MMDEESAKTRETTVNQQQQYYYGTFQGVANYPPPAPPPQLLPLPQQPIATSPLIPPVHGYQNLPGHGGGFVNYAQGYPVVPQYTVVEVRPVREHDVPVPCCGFGMGWFLFIMGFLFGGIPWYLGAVIILFTSVDHREKAGYVACSIASVVYLIAVMLGMAGNINIIW
ncbi:hypothetical protein IGI04_036585 [Brassica rapa subsp. trilocularis]|uniref:60S ribosomal protein L18a-like protein n=1 Tax=Brassica rapa subsp. trilocularis TaxID=1813537 RepID=A0ABQ7LGP6_BRACM|nr:hypothetical protein IGI04_036585 [Brassica rapa subsp. trilocularis]